MKRTAKIEVEENANVIFSDRRPVFYGALFIVEKNYSVS